MLIYNKICHYQDYHGLVQSDPKIIRRYGIKERGEIAKMTKIRKKREKKVKITYK